MFFLVLIQDDLTSARTNTTNLQESKQENMLQLESQESNRKPLQQESQENESQQKIYELQQESQQNESQQESQELFR